MSALSGPTDAPKSAMAMEGAVNWFLRFIIADDYERDGCHCLYDYAFLTFEIAQSGGRNYGLRVLKGPVIGVVMDYFDPDLIQGAGAYAREHGLHLDARWSVRADWMPQKPPWDGVLVNLIDMENAYLRVEGLNLPTLHLGGWLGKKARPRVEPDYAECGRLAAEEFHRLGISRVAAMPGWGNPVDWRSYRGLRVAMRRLGLQWIEVPSWKSKVPFFQILKPVALEVVAGGLPCGLFVPHAGFTMSLTEEFEALGVRIPEDVAIIVIDKDPQRTSELAPVPLTGVRPDGWEQGYQACAMLHQMICGKPVGKRILRIPPTGLARRASTGVEASRDPVVGKALHAIRVYPLTKLEVPQLVELVGTSRRNLEQRFRKATGSTLHAAITLRKVEEAKRLLRASEMPLLNIADTCGYSSVHYFTTAFKRVVGTSPGAWRKNQSRQ